ncbi:MAG: redoxin domain-containing protein [Pseudomonadota bacterium]
MAQFVQLQEYLGEFKASGIGVVGLTYDAPELQQAFVDKNGIGYPLLSDDSAATVKALGILNTEYSPGDSAYGIPYPGIFVIDAEGEIVGKIFLDGYRQRVSADAVLAYAQLVLGIPDS